LNKDTPEKRHRHCGGVFLIWCYWKYFQIYITWMMVKINLFNFGEKTHETVKHSFSCCFNCKCNRSTSRIGIVEA
ncbi:TPA: hypothetical protein ACNTAF_004730, partial [Escherichia coli]